MLSGMEYVDGILLHTYVFCWDVLRMYPKTTRVMGIPTMTMMNQRTMVLWTSIYIYLYGISIGR